MKILIPIVLFSLLLPCINPIFAVEEESVMLNSANIIYQESFPIDTNLEGQLFSIESGRYSSTEVSSMSITGQTNAFNCILTRWMIRSSGLISLASLLEYQRNPSTCLSGSEGGLPQSTMEYIPIENGEIEAKNHGRPESPSVIINPDIFDPNIPAAWSQTLTDAYGNEEVQWYYNRLGAEEEALYTGFFLPSIEDFASLLEYSIDPLSDLPLSGYATIGFPYMSGWDVQNGYYWTRGEEFEEFYEGFAYDALNEIKTKFYVEKGENIILPLRLMR